MSDRRDDRTRDDIRELLDAAGRGAPAPHGWERVVGPREVATDRPPGGRRRWMLAAAAAVIAIGGFGYVGAQQSRSTDSDADVDGVPVDTTAPEVRPTDPPGDLDDDPGAEQTDTESPTPVTPTSTPPMPDTVAVPLDPERVVPVSALFTLEYGPGETQIDVPNGEFPPPAVWLGDDVLVLEDTLGDGLSGEAVIVELPPSPTSAGSALVGSASIEITEPGGSPIAVRGLDADRIVIATVHDEDPAVRIRSYGLSAGNTLIELDDRADIEALGDSQLGITSDGATWGGEMVVPASPLSSRPEVSVFPPFFQTPSDVVRTTSDGDITWALDVEIDEEFPPLSGEGLVEPFGDGAVAVIRGSSRQFSKPTLVVLDRGGGGTAYDLDGWRVSDVQPNGVLLSRSTSIGLELAVLKPATIAALNFNFGGAPGSTPSVFGYEGLSTVDDAALIEDVTSQVGSPDADTGWLPMPEAFACTGESEYRSVLWNDVRFVLHRSERREGVLLAAWSIGSTTLSFSPPLDTPITMASGITSTEGIGLGSAADQVEELDWDQSMRSSDEFSGLAGIGPVIFTLVDEQVAAMSFEQNDC